MHLLKIVVLAILEWFGSGRRLLLRLALSGLGMALGYVLVHSEIGRATEPYIQAMINARRQAAVAVSYGDSLVRVADDRQRRIVILEGDVRELKRRRPSQAGTDSLRRIADSLYVGVSDSLKQVVSIIPIQHDLIQRQDSTIRVLDAISVRQQLMLVKKDSTITELLSVTDSMRVVLTTLPKPPKPIKLLGFLPMPNRKTAAVLGFLGGVVVTAAVVK